MKNQINLVLVFRGKKIVLVRAKCKNFDISHYIKVIVIIGVL